MSVSNQDVQDQLQRRLPARRLSEEHHHVDLGEELFERARSMLATLVVYCVQRGERVPQLRYRRHVAKSKVFRDGPDGPLSHHQNVLVVVSGEQLEWRVRHDDLVLVDVDAQPGGQGRGLGLAQAVAGVGDEDGGHAEGAVVAHQAAEGSGRERKHLAAAHDDAVDVEEQAEVGRTGRGGGRGRGKESGQRASRRRCSRTSSSR